MRGTRFKQRKQFSAISQGKQLTDGMERPESELILTILYQIAFI